MADWEKLFPGRFLRAVDFDGKDVTLTITKLRQEDLPQEKGADRMRPILGFKETRKELVLNKTNAQPLAAMFGRDTDAWMGHRVTFYPAKIDSDIADVAIRVRGSPELSAPVEYELKLPRRKPRTLKLICTSKANGKAPAKAAAQPEDPPDAGPEEIEDTIGAAQRAGEPEQPGDIEF